MTKSKKAIIIVAIVLVLPLLLGITDYNRVNRQNPPLFCFQVAGLSDGGSTIWIGWGYALKMWHATVAVFDSDGKSHPIGYKVGPRLTFWFLLGRENTWFEQMEKEPPTKPSNATPEPAPGADSEAVQG